MTDPLADRIAKACAAGFRRSATGAPHRFLTEVAGVTVAGLGLPESWATAIVALPEPPSAAAVAAALDWCAGRQDAACVFTRERDAHRYPTLRADETMPVFVAPARPDPARSAAFETRPAATAAEFNAIYASAFDMPPGMAEALVVDADLGADWRTHLVGLVDRTPVACAILREVDGLCAVGGVGVVPAAQRRGYGTQMLAACQAEANRRGSDAVWLHAAPSARGFYESLGYRLVDTHVELV